MDARELLIDTFGRIRGLYVGVAEDLDLAAAHHRPDGTGNSIAWLLWHVARLQDDHVVGLTGGTQLWHGEWADRFGLPFDRGDIGYGHSAQDVDAVQVARLDDLVDYQEAVHQQALRYLETVDADELDRVVDRNWNPPVTAGVRLVSLVGDCLQHLGQAAYVKGLPRSAG
jgi:uncharacterized damage-inducible protein DinB